jgi:ketosteroid isomerase-like protein
MSQENVEIVRRAWEAAERRDTEVVFALYDPDIVWQSHYGPVSGTYHGHEGVRQFFHEWTEALESFRAHAEEFIDAGDSVVVCAMVWARGRGSGVEAEMPQGFLYTVKDGLVTRIEIFEGKERALAAAGLGE